MAVNGDVIEKMWPVIQAIHAEKNPAIELGRRPNLGVTSWDLNDLYNFYFSEQKND
jgi:hypothetical protein